MDKDSIYFDALKENLTKKLAVFDSIYNIVQEQSEVLIDKEVDIDRFNQLLDEKEELIRQVDELDKSFETLYVRIKDILTDNKEEYRLAIVNMQDIIRNITSLGVKIKVLEQQNKMKVEIYLENKKNIIKSFKSNSNMSKKYTQSMTNQHYGQSYFYDKKK
nr:flagellar export chaperone FlgN [uncultured Anaerosporobacter sp.]